MMTAYGGRHYMWGNTPALDVLSLKQNEGFDEVRDYSLLFAGKTTTPLEAMIVADIQQPPAILETW
jgi:hypothetical protein